MNWLLRHIMCVPKAWYKNYSVQLFQETIEPFCDPFLKIYIFSRKNGFGLRVIVKKVRKYWKTD